MKYLSLLMLFVCMSAFANAENSAPVKEKERKVKPAKTAKTWVAPAFVNGPNQTAYVCNGAPVNLTPLLSATDADGASGTPPTVSWGPNFVDPAYGNLMFDNGFPWNSVNWAAGVLQPSANMIYTPVPGATGSTNVIVQVTDGTSAAFTTITIIFSSGAPVVGTQPSSADVCTGTPASFTVVPDGGNPAPNTFQWQVKAPADAGFTDIPGAQGATLSFTSSMAENGNQYQVVITNACGSVTSTPATLTVRTAPSVAPVITGSTLVSNTGGTGSYSVTAPPADAQSYTWSFSQAGATFSGNTASVTVNFSGNTDGDVTVQYDNGCGMSPLSNAVAVHFVAPPTVVADNVSVAEGTTDVSGNVLTNDTYDAATSTTVSLVAGASQPGTLTLQPNGLFEFSPANLDFAGNVTFTYSLDDGVNPPTAPATVTITFTPVNDDPVIHAPVSFTMTEDQPFTLSSLTFTDTDLDPLLNQAVSITLTPSSGAITLTAAPSGMIVVNAAGNVLTLTGTIFNINNYLTGGNVVYNAPANSTAAFQLTAFITDFGNTGTGGVLTATTTVPVNITAVNDAPTATAPAGTRNVLQTGTLTYNGANLISVDDIDAGTGSVEVTINATNGTLSLSGVAGLSFSTGDGTADAGMTFTGTVTDINNALNGLVFTPTPAYYGPAQIALTVDDLGNTGTGGNLTATASTNINVLSVPVVQSVSTINNDRTYKVGETITVILHLSEAVMPPVGGSPTLELETGTTDRVATYTSSGSTSTSLNFTYTVQSGDESADLDVTGINALSLNGATIANSTGTGLAPALPSPGGAGSLSVTHAIVIDGIIPAAPVTITPVTATTTADNTPVYTGTAEPNATVEIFVDGNSIGTVNVNASGNWSFTPIIPLADGPHSVYAITIDVAGNRSAAGNTNNFTVDTTPPAAPVTLTPANGSVTGDNTPTYAGTAEPASTVTVIVDGTAAGTATADASGNWSFTQPTALAGGAHNVRATATDASGNTSLNSNTNTFTIDLTAPGVAITSAAPAIVNVSFTATFEFTEDVTGFVIGDITAGNANLSGFSAVDGNTYEVTVTPVANGAVTLDIAAAVAEDFAGNDNTAAAQFSRTYDDTHPGVTITSAAPANTNVSPIPVTIEFSEDVTGFAASDLVAGNATVSNFVVVDGNTYTADIVPSGNGTVTLDVAAAVAQDNAGNDNTAAAQFSRTYDDTHPAVTITSAAPVNTNVSPIPVTIEFSEDVTGFAAGDLVAGNATVSNFVVVDGNTYTADVVPSGNGTVTLDVAAAVAQDNAGNDNTAAAQFSRTYDASQPGVTITSAAAAIVNASFTATIEFTEDVTGFVIGDITAGNANLSGFSAVDGNTYEVTVTPVANGAVTLDIAAAVAEDFAGNDNTAAAQFSRTYDDTHPAVTITSAAPVNTNVSPIPVTIEFSEDVTGFVAGDLVAGNATVSNFAAVDGNTYTADIVPSGNGTVTLDVAAAVAQDNAGNDNTAAAQFSRTYDASQPAVTITSAAAAIVNASFTATIEFTEDVNGFVIGDITAGNANLSGFSAVDGNTYEVTVTPVANGVVTLDVAAAVAEDFAGNDNTAAAQFSRTYDDTHPTVTITSAAPANTNVSPIPVTIEFTEDVTGFAAGDLVAGNATVSNFVAVDGNTYTADIVPSGNGTVTLDVAAAVAQDNAGNDNTAAAQFSRTYDATAPTVIVTIAAPVAPAAYIATFTFSEPVTSFDITDINVANGTASNFTAVNGTTYTAEITPSSCTFTITANAGGATDAAGNTNAVSNTLSTTQPAPVITITSNKPLEVVANETVILTASGATTYQWVNAHGIVSGQNTAQLTIEATQTTTYTVTGTNQWGCAGTATYQQEIDAAPAVPVITVPANNSTTSDLRPVISGTADANTIITVYLNGASQGTVTANGTGNWSFTPAADLATGAYAATATASTPLGTASAHSAMVNFTIDNGAPAINITASVPDATTGKFTATFTFSEQVTGFTATDITANGGTIDLFTPVSTSVYTAEITPTACTVTMQVIAGVATDLAGNNNTASNTSSTTLPNPVVTITSSKPATVVAGENVMLTASGATTYQWANAHGIVSGQNTAQLTIEATQTTTYTVTGTSRFGCTATATYQQMIDAAPAVPVITVPANATVTSSVRPVISGTADANTTITVYLNGASQGTVTANGTGNWNFVPAADLAEGAYAATATASTPLGTASAHSATVNFTIDVTTPTVTLTVSTPDALTGVFTGTFTFSEPVTGFSASDITVNGGTPGTFMAVSTTVYTMSITPTACTSTLQTAAGTATDAAGNTNSASGTGSVTQPAPTVTITSDKPATVPAGETVILTASGAATYVWANAHGIISGQNTAQLTIEPTQNTTYTVTGTSQFGCTATAQYSQQVDITPPTPAAPAITSPVDGTATNSPRPVISGTSQPNMTITVYFNNTSSGTTTADATGAWSFTPAADLADGAYAATATATNAQNITSTQSAAVNFSIERVRPAVTATATTPNAVTGIFEVTFTFSEPVTGFTQADITHPRSTINSFTAVSATVYRISVTPSECAANFDVAANAATDAAGNSNTAGATLQVMQASPVISITADKPNPVSLGETVTLTATGGSYYIWEPSPTIVSGMNTPRLTVRPAEDYTYRVAGYSQWGCMTQATISITVTADYKVDATNVITPNGDGINDRWVIRNIAGYPDNLLRIFDRAGQLVYQKRNYANEWNGTTASGQPLAEGAYFFILEIDNGKKVVKGYITLIREK